jgi:hypothetical protein
MQISKKTFLAILATVLVVVFSACSTTNDPVITSTVKTPGTLSVSLTTSTYNGNYAPKHVLAIWIENGSGSFVKTLMVKAAARKQYLTNWLSSTSSGNSTDAVTGATLSSHGTRTCTWNGTDVSGNVVYNGTYKLCMEFTENDKTGKFASFTFLKDSVSQSVSPTATSNFSGISINWTPTAQ